IIGQISFTFLFVFSNVNSLGKYISGGKNEPSQYTSALQSALTCVEADLHNKLVEIATLANIGSKLKETKTPAKPKSKKKDIPLGICNGKITTNFSALRSLGFDLSNQAALINKNILNFQLYCLFWMMCFLSLFWLRKLKFLFTLPRASIDDIIGGTGYFYTPVCL
ncbi:MAG: hypothetical protein JW871_02585, partial [Endomicrobiales bacterium]|nr:hypothetical protein [Endomicrobiales bacterium]